MKCIITPCGSTMGQDFIGEGRELCLLADGGRQWGDVAKDLPVFSLEG